MDINFNEDEPDRRMKNYTRIIINIVISRFRMQTNHSLLYSSM